MTSLVYHEKVQCQEKDNGNKMFYVSKCEPHGEEYIATETD